MRLTILIFLLLLAYLANSQAIITDRPDQTEATAVVGKNGFQLETGLLYSTEEGGGTSWSLNNSLFRAGISDKIEFRVVTDLISVADNDSDDPAKLGLADLQLGFKYLLIDGPIEFAYLGHVLLPTGTNFLSSNDYGYTQRLLIAGDLSQNLAIGVNLGYDYITPDLDYFIYTLSLGFSVNDKIGFFAEVFGDIDTGGRDQNNFDIGFTYLINNDLQLDFSTGADFDYESNFISFGLSKRFLQN